MGLHCDTLNAHPHWPPVHWTDSVSWYEHKQGAAEGFGLYLPAGLCETRAGRFPHKLDMNSDYKTLTLKLPTQWGLASPAFVGKAAFTTPPGVADMRSTRSHWPAAVMFPSPTPVILPSRPEPCSHAQLQPDQSSRAICVPTQGFTDETTSTFGILTDRHFTASGCLKASYTWSQSLAYLPYDHASDYAGSVPSR